MPSVLAYHRPGTLEEASTLLAGTNRTAIGGGTFAVPAARIRSDSGVEVVDLQGLGLDSIDVDDGAVTLGAMVRLGTIMNDDRMPKLIRELAQRELPSALRNQATIGGTIALAEPDSVLLAGLLVSGASVQQHRSDPVELDALLGAGIGHGLITHVHISRSGTGAIAATGRTPADVPIVSAVARSSGGSVRLALTGVAPTPILVDPADPTAGLEPASDFRAASAYRTHLASVLASRVLEEVSS